MVRGVQVGTEEGIGPPPPTTGPSQHTGGEIIEAQSRKELGSPTCSPDPGTCVSPESPGPEEPRSRPQVCAPQEPARQPSSLR